MFVNNMKNCSRKYYACGYCCRNHTIYLNNGRNLSTYVSALKLLLKRKQNLKKVGNENFNKLELARHLQKKKKLENRYTDLVKVFKSKSKETKMAITDLKASEVTAFAEEPGMTYRNAREKNKISYDSTQSYDPSVIFSNTSLESMKNIMLKNSENLKCVMLNSTKPSTNIMSNINSVNKSLSVKIVPIESSSKSNSKIKPVISSQKLKLSRVSEVDDNFKKDVMKILPLTAVEIFPMPRKLQKNITKKSEKAIKELTDSGCSKMNQNLPKPYETVLPYESLYNMEEKERINTDKSETLDEDYNPFINKNLENITIDSSLKELELKHLIHSYIDVAVSNQMVDEGLNIMSFLRKKKFWKAFVLKNNYSHTYNILLHSYSTKGDWETICKITDWMILDGVKFNCQTYAAILDCLGRISSEFFQSENLWRTEVLKYLGMFHVNNFSLNDLFTKTTLTQEKQETILFLLRRVLPEFEIEPTKIKLSSNCPLLKNLYKDNNSLQSQLGNEFLNEEMENLVKEQLTLEKNYIMPVKSIYERTSKESNEIEKKCEAQNSEWRKMLEKAFIQYLKKTELKHKKYSENLSLYIYLKSLPVETFVDVMMRAVKTLVEYSGSYSPNTSILYRTLGNEIYQHYLIKKKINTEFLNKIEILFQKYCDWYVNPLGPAKNTRQEWQMLIQEFNDGKQLDSNEIKWPSSIKFALGKYLYNLIFNEVKINAHSKKNGSERLIPAFYLMVRYKKGVCSEEVKCHPMIHQLFGKTCIKTLYFYSNQIPMVCPPKPWKDVNDGGYLILPTEFIRPSEKKVDKKFDMKKVPVEQLYSTFDSLNALQSVPWTVNEDVLNVVIEVFQNGGSDELNVPKFPDMSPIPKKLTYDMTLQDRCRVYKERQKETQERQNQYGLWCEALYRLSLANHYRKRVFWFPQNFDFRGRVYPVPPHLNHLGSDVFRSLLLFAKGKPIGPKGLDWLKIHTINLTGTHKKKSVGERLEYANTILPDILDSAEKPLTGNKWWMKSEEPWQTLAACIEIKNVVSSPNPEMYKSRFPIHQDGSCNGLQHYAALGRDTIGAKSVNLSPSIIPQDVYSFVTQIIEEERLKDVANGLEIAEVLTGFIQRKVIKQTIMTTVYGVTHYGARQQIARQLEDLNEFPKEYVWKAAGYLTDKTFKSLQQMFTSAKEIQDWFLRCADIICQKNNYIQWMSPLGLPVYQPYSKVSSKALQESRRPNTRKQKNAFAPNFIHSLDSSHMMLTSLFCEQSGLTFASIHDCFWTHPSTVDVMNKICREQFISLHSLPILQNLSKFFIECYLQQNDKKDAEAFQIFNSVPQTGNFDLKSVLDSKYFFS